ncbi:MAG TPA: FAD-binding oxidoreductase [Gaiella sp.]|uniref:FAD-binding oxidoreductase n=1 Tax=Gaiella sp. TaxID=2663207 RepID=UPI002D7E5BCD|nr:FAD-binding oxidoreductase [Gaiella sp.]HET9289418.1 FAD-binding oxidoreductase [Gaiella sp.]
MLTITSFETLSAQMNGRVVTQSDPDWDATRQVFNLATDVRPAAVALPRDVSDVVAAVGYARRNGLRVAPQATGHNADAHGALEDTLLVDVRELQEVFVDARARRVRVGAGVKWGRVAPGLSDHGLAALHGSSPDVGVAGYSLGGGMGWLARKYGLQTNSVTAIELVTAEGRATRVDAEDEADLFWALRGGNGNFGVVTAIEFAVYPVEHLYAGVMFFPFERASDVLHAWTELVPTLPDEMMSWASLLQFPDAPFVPDPVRGGSFAVVYGAFLGSEAEGRTLLRPVRDLAPAMDTFAMVPPAALGTMAMDPPDPLPFVPTTALLDDLPHAGVDELVAAVGPESGSNLAMVELRQLGGALGRRTPGAGARATLPGALSLIALGVPEDAESEAKVRAYLESLDRAVRPYRVGDYANFVMEPTDASRFFDPETWARLRQVKALYDPGDLFKGNHHIPPAY